MNLTISKSSGSASKAKWKIAGSREGVILKENKKFRKPKKGAEVAANQEENSPQEEVIMIQEQEPHVIRNDNVVQKKIDAR
jgi:hypothetical protein